MEYVDEVVKFVFLFLFGFRVIGFFLCGKSKDEWIIVLVKFKICYGDKDVEIVIRFVYEGLFDK